MGRVEEHRGTFVVTQFVHVYYLPLFPLRSHLVLESGPGPGGIRRSVPIKLHAASVVAGYLRPWCAVAACVCLAAAIAAGPGWGATQLAWGLAATLLALLALWTRTRLGRLNSEAIAHRQVYAALTHESVDAALLGDADAWRAALLANVAEGARGMLTMNYRTSLDPEKEWMHVALDPTVRDSAFLQACFTLARIEWGRAEGAARTRLAEQHRQIWQKLQALDERRLPAPPG